MRFQGLKSWKCFAFHRARIERSRDYTPGMLLHSTGPEFLQISREADFACAKARAKSGLIRYNDQEEWQPHLGSVVRFGCLHSGFLFWKPALDFDTKNLSHPMTENLKQAVIGVGSACDDHLPRRATIKKCQSLPIKSDSAGAHP